MADTPTRKQAIATFAEMITGIPVAMLTTTGLGRLRSRPMVTPRRAVRRLPRRHGPRRGEDRGNPRPAGGSRHVRRAVGEPVRLGVRHGVDCG